jgi:hypothetical protein
MKVSNNAKLVIVGAVVGFWGGCTFGSQVRGWADNIDGVKKSIKQETTQVVSDSIKTDLVKQSSVITKKVSVTKVDYNNKAVITDFIDSFRVVPAALLKIEHPKTK